MMRNDRRQGWSFGEEGKTFFLLLPSTEGTAKHLILPMEKGSRLAEKHHKDGFGNATQSTSASES